MVLNYILIFCSGLTFAIGSINFAIGISLKKDRSYLYFGLLSLFASAFLFIQVQTISTFDVIRTIDLVSVIAAVAFYTLFIWFIGEYTGYKKMVIQIVISILAISLVFIYILVWYSKLDWQIWEALAHLIILFISSYGIVAGIKGLIGEKKLWRSIYLLLIFFLFCLTIIIGISIVFDVTLIYDPAGFISLLDFFPVFFSIIIGYKMGNDIIRSYFLDKKLERKEKEWSSLMEEINLLIIKLNPAGKIEYVNKYFHTLTGYSPSEVLGEDWFHLMIDKQEIATAKHTFSKIINGADVSTYQNYIITRKGEKKSIQWSNLHLFDYDEQISGTLSIGTDVTNRESTLAEISLLKNQLERENILLREEISAQESWPDIIGESDSIKYAIKRAIQVADTDSTVLLEGETGVGKELFANLIHRKCRRSMKPFIKVNCSAISKELIESEFFGHEKGAFTGALKTRQGRFELADKGTIFLDEIGEIPFDLQAKLLRVIQSGEFERVGSEITKKVDVRIIAATNKDLDQESQKGAFRQDLFYRLNVYPITIPPLRHRKEDIPLLVHHFIDKIGRKMEKKIEEISKSDLLKLSDYAWPGNVRELENIIERAIINSTSNVLRIEDNKLKSAIEKNYITERNGNEANLSETERNHILNVLEGCNWKINGEDGAAQKLGIPPSTLRSKMKKLNIVRPD
jgi:PAS domain S-box-containing protein